MTRITSFGLILDPQNLVMGVQYGAIDGGGWGVTLHFLPGLALQITSQVVAEG